MTTLKSPRIIVAGDSVFDNEPYVCESRRQNDHRNGLMI